MTKTKKKKTVKEQPPPPQVETLEWETVPVEEGMETAAIHTWYTKDKKYQVKRIDSIGMLRPMYGAQYLTPQKTWDIFEYDSKQGTGYPRYYKSLEDALTSVELYHIKKTGKVSVKTNTQEVIAQAHKLGLDGYKVAQAAPGATQATESEPGAARPPRKRSTGKMSCLDAAALVLKEEGKPLTTEEMITLMAQRDYWTSPSGLTPSRTLGAGIGQEIKKPQSRFVKVGKDLYSLSS